MSAQPSDFRRKMMIKKDYISEIEFIDIFADNLRDLMIEADLSQVQLAEESGLDRSTINRLLNKRTMPTAKAIMNLCYPLGCTYSDLLPTYSLVN